MSKQYCPLEHAKSETSIPELETLRRNAYRNDREDVADACTDRIIVLKLIAEGATNQFERDFYSALQAYEKVLTDKNGKVTYAQYTRRKIDNVGVQQTLTDLMKKGDQSYGLGVLRERNALEFAFENVVINHPDRFNEETVKSAHRNLENETSH